MDSSVRSALVAVRRLSPGRPFPAYTIREKARLGMIRCSYSFYAQCGAIALVTAFLVFWQPAAAGAQASKVGAALEGAVRDSTNAVIPGAGVTLRNTATSQTRSVMTNGEGIFHAEALQVGTYEVRVDQPGFTPYRHTGVDLALGETIR